jgi:hypothetical protein
MRTIFDVVAELQVEIEHLKYMLSRNGDTDACVRRLEGLHAELRRLIGPPSQAARIASL